MMKSYFRILLLSSLFVSGSTFAGQEKSIELKWGLNLDPLHYFIPAANRFKKNVEKRTDKRVVVTLKIKEFDQLERDHLKDVNSGRYDMGQDTVLALRKYDPNLAIWELPFLFRSNKQVFAYMESPLAKDVYKNLKSFGVTAVSYTYSGGFLYLYGDKVNDFVQLKDKTLGLEEHSLSYSRGLYEKLNIKTVKYGFDNYSAPASEVISSAADDILNLPSEKRRFINLSEHRVSARILFLSNDFLEKLSEKDKKIVLEEAHKAGVFERELAVEKTVGIENKLVRSGSTINEWSEKDKDRSLKYFKNNYDNYVLKHGRKYIDFIQSLKK